MNLLESVLNYLRGTKRQQIPQMSYVKPLEKLAYENQLKAIRKDDYTNVSGGGNYKFMKRPLVIRDGEIGLEEGIDEKRCEHCSVLYYYFDNRPNVLNK